MKKTAKIASVSGLNIHNLSAEEIGEAMDWRGNVYAGSTQPGWKPSWDRAGVEALVDSAKEYYEYKAGRELPYNLAIHGPWVSYPTKCSFWEGAEEMVGTAARMASWLKIIADENYVGLQRLFEKNLGRRTSRRTNICYIYKLLEAWNSPRTAENIFWKSYRRAWQILKPFGLAPSWKAVGDVMTSPNISRRVGRMAFAIAARTINCYLSDKSNLLQCPEVVLMGSSVEILMKARGVALFKRFNREERLKYAWWAITRIEEGEFCCLREAFAAMKNRLVDWGDGTVVDLGRVKKHFGCMVEVPVAFPNSGWNSPLFVFAGQTILERTPKVAWQKFMAAEILRRRYGQEEVEVRDLYPRLSRNEESDSTHAGVRRAVRRWLNGKLVRGSHGNLPLKCFRGLKKFPASKQVRVWAFDRIIETGSFDEYGRNFKAGEFCNYEEAILSSGRLVPDSSDGVELLLDPKTSQIIHRVKCTVGWDKDGERQFLCQQLGTGRTYHVGINWCIGANEPRKAVKEAIKAWRRQAKLEREQADLVAFLRGDHGFCPLIRREESYRAGNCQAGTASWLRQQGWENKQFIPAEWLISHLDYNLVRNTAMVLYRDLAELRKVA